MSHGGIFLDRDGTINEEVDYVSLPDDLQLIPGSGDAIRQANELGFKVVVITNQSGIARGLFTEDDLAKVHHALTIKLQQHNAHIDAIYYCPHHPEFGNDQYKIDCDCRKPNTGMILRGAQKFNLDLKKSFVIGDRMIDMQTGNTVGATTILVLTGYGKGELGLCRSSNARIDYIAEDLLDAVQFIKRMMQKEELSIS